MTPVAGLIVHSGTQTGEKMDIAEEHLEVEGTYATACAAYESWSNAALVVAPGGQYLALYLAPFPREALRDIDARRRAPSLCPITGTLYYAYGHRATPRIVRAKIEDREIRPRRE